MNQQHPLLTHNFRAMASPITITIVEPAAGAQQAMREAIAVIEEVAAACTRFDPTSPLMRANAQPAAWHKVPMSCVNAVREAFHAYTLTDGLFDPRVLDALDRIGYGHTRTFTDEPLMSDDTAVAEERTRAPWQPEFDGNRMCLGDAAVDLGGIGKGLAVRWAAEQLSGHGRGFLVDAGGDIALEGVAPNGSPWRIGIENPWNAAGDPVAVVESTSGAVATSSIRIRSWVQDGKAQHHLIDPRTGAPGGEGLVSVSVIGDDPAIAEVWSKTLFLHGARGIAAACLERDLAAVWVQTDGTVGVSASATPHVIWRVADAPRN